MCSRRQIAMETSDSESGYKRSVSERAPMPHHLAEVTAGRKRREMIERNRCRVLRPQANLNASHLLFDECGLAGHHVVAAFRASNNRRGGSVFVVARARGRHGWVTPDETRQPRLLPSSHRQHDGNDTCSNHANTRHFRRQEQGQR
jgi:hypothetical protein